MSPLSSHYSAGGRAHKAMAVLARGPASVGHLRHIVLPEGSANQRRKFYSVVSALDHDGLIRRIGPDYAITPKGRDLLSKLSAISDPFPGVVTSCRVFRERAEVEA